MKKSIFISFSFFYVFLTVPLTLYSQNETLEIFNDLKIKQYLKQKRASSLMVGVFYKNKKYIYSYGEIKTIGKKSIKPDEKTLYEIGSITKVFTSLLLAESIKNNQNKLEDVILGFLPEKKYHKLMSSLTFKQLATHTSGLPPLAKNSINKLDALNFLLFGGNPYKNYSTKKMIKDLKTVSISSNQGKKMVYSNYGVGLLGYILSSQSGLRFEDLLKKTIFNPLEMKNSYIGVPNSKKSNFAAGRRFLGLKAKKWSKPGGLEAAGSIVSSLEDMMKFLEANLFTSSPISDILTYTQKTYFDVSETRKMGLGWVKTTSEKSGNSEVVWHNGGTGGFRSFLGFNKENKTGVVVLSNCNLSVDDIAFDILKQLQ